MTPFEIPLQAASQKFSITLAQVAYVVVVRWNPRMQSWVIDMLDASEAPILEGVPLVTGADLLEPYRYLGFGGAMIVQTDHDQDAVPTFENLGLTSHLYFLTP